jgi:hypothetical protein
MEDDCFLSEYGEEVERLLDRPFHRDRCGNPIPLGRWLDLHQDPSYIRVAETVVGGVWRVSTVWLGTDHQFLAGPPLIFETMVFELAESHGFMEAMPAYGLAAHGYVFHADVGEQWRYSTETQAREGHAVMVRLCRERFLPCRR